jgi:hypothetical protein
MSYDEINDHPVYRQIVREADAAVAMAKKLEEQAARDPIKAFGIEYTPDEGFTAEPIDLEGEYLNGEITALFDDGDEYNEFSFEPEGFGNNLYAVEPLDVCIASYGILIAFKISNFDPKYRIKLDWCKKSEPSSSRIYLVDTEHDAYYYPRASTLLGEVVIDADRYGIIAFEPLKHAPETLELHISDVKLTSQRGDRVTMRFEIEHPRFAAEVARIGGQASLTERIEREVDQAVAHARTLAQEATRSQRGGCLSVLLLALIPGAIIFSVVAVGSRGPSVALNHAVTPVQGGLADADPALRKHQTSLAAREVYPTD